jgi:hypothetical protein
MNVVAYFFPAFPAKSAGRFYRPAIEFPKALAFFVFARFFAKNGSRFFVARF